MMAFRSNEFLDEWRIIKFRDCIIQLNTGLNPRDNFSLGSGEIKYITAKNLSREGTIDFTVCDYIDLKAKEVIHKRSDIQKGDILFASRAPIGHCHLIKEEPSYFDVGESIFCIRVDKNVVLPEYLCLYLSSDFFIQMASKRVTGSVIQEIRIGDLLDTDVIVPPQKIQQRIAKKIGVIDEKLELNKAICSDLEAMAKLLYDYWFVQFDFPDENGRPYKSSGGKMVWNEELKREIPEGWEVKPVLEVFDWIGTSQPPKSTFKYEPRDGYVRFIQNRDYDTDNHITYIPLTESTRTCNKWDIMMDKYGDAGKIRFGIAGAYNVALSKISVHDNKMREYVRAYLKSDTIYNYLHAACMASTRASLNEANFDFLSIVIPNNTTLNKFDDLAKSIITKQFEIKSENQQLASLRDFLLPMLMNGQVKVGKAGG